jgi:hypothetical protein
VAGATSHRTPEPPGGVPGPVVAAVVVAMGAFVAWLLAQMASMSHQNLDYLLTIAGGILVGDTALAVGSWRPRLPRVRRFGSASTTGQAQRVVDADVVPHAAPALERYVGGGIAERRTRAGAG